VVVVELRAAAIVTFRLGTVLMRCGASGKFTRCEVALWPGKRKLNRRWAQMDADGRGWTRVGDWEVKRLRVDG
jgi:hypothetical protein